MFQSAEFPISPAVLHEMTQCALLDPEKEICGFVYFDRYVPLTNQVSSANMFVADPASLARTLASFGEPDAIFHTHPNGILHPSEEDNTRWYYPRSILIIGTVAKCDFQFKAFRNAGQMKSKSR